MIIKVNDINDAALRPYAHLTEAQLRVSEEAAWGLFIAESPKVIRVALDAGYEPLSLLCEARHITGDAADIIARCPAEMPVYTGERAMLKQLTGYQLTRGVLCAMKRRPLPTLEEVCRDARRIVVIDNVVDTTNIGAIFRSATALGIDAIVVTADSCDPLNRRAIRVSMGTVFKMEWTMQESKAMLSGLDKAGRSNSGHPIMRTTGQEQRTLCEQPTLQAQLNALGFKTVAMALTERSTTLDDPRLRAEPRLAIVMGTEGDGLPQEAIINADYVVRIPMARGVDSLNVAAACAVACYSLSSREP